MVVGHRGLPVSRKLVLDCVDLLDILFVLGLGEDNSAYPQVYLELSIN